MFNIFAYIWAIVAVGHDIFTTLSAEFEMLSGFRRSILSWCILTKFVDIDASFFTQNQVASQNCVIYFPKTSKYLPDNPENMHSYLTIIVKIANFIEFDQKSFPSTRLASPRGELHEPRVHGPSGIDVQNVGHATAFHVQVVDLHASLRVHPST